MSLGLTIKDIISVGVSVHKCSYTIVGWCALCNGMEEWLGRNLVIFVYIDMALSYNNA